MLDLGCKLLAPLLRGRSWPDDRRFCLRQRWRSCCTPPAWAQAPSVESSSSVVCSSDRPSICRTCSGDRCSRHFAERSRAAGLQDDRVDCADRRADGAARSSRRDWMARLCIACPPATVLTSRIECDCRRNLGTVASPIGMGMRRVSTERRSMALYGFISCDDHSGVVHDDLAVQPHP